MGIPKNNALYGGRIPDGKTVDYLHNFFIAHEQPFFIEVKARLGSTFDYGSQLGQLTDYLAYLQNNSNMANTTIIHGLYLILPAGVELASNVKNAASAQNVPLYVSYVELKDNNVSQFRVKAPELVNFSNLNYSGHLLFGWVPGGVIKDASERRKRDYIGLKHQPVLIDFQKFADEFETSHLIGSQAPDCPPGD